MAGNTDELIQAIYQSNTDVNTDNNRSCLREIIAKKAENDNLDPSFVLADKVVQQALEMEDGRDIGLICATSLGGISSAESFLSKKLNGSKSSDPSNLINYPIPAIADFLVKKHKLKGPTASFSTACTSSFVALGYAMELLYAKEINKVLVCAVDVLCQQTIKGFKAIGASTEEPARPFDKDRKGLNLGEAAAAILLERTDFLSPGVIEITGYGLSNDSFHLTAPHPNGKGLRYAIDMAMDEAGILPDEIDIVHAHGTGTKYSDAMELTTLEQLFSDAAYPVPVFSTKGQTGHTLGPSGLLSLIIGCLSLRNGLIPGTKNFVSSEFDLKHIALDNKNNKNVKMTKILITSSGFTGHNGAIIAEKTV